MEENKNERRIIFEKCDSKLCLWIMCCVLRNIRCLLSIFVIFYTFASESNIVNISLT